MRYATQKTSDNIQYIVVKDGDGYGVEWHGAFINEQPMSKADAQELANYCNTPSPRPVDVNPTWEM